MVKLQMTDSSGRIREFTIGPKPTSFGQGEDNDVVLGSRKVARRHMVIWEDQGRVMVEDLTAGKGIKLDGAVAQGVFELIASSKMEVGVFVFQLAQDDISAGDTDTLLFSRDGPMPFLESWSGEGEGVEVELRPGNNDIGSDPSLYLVIGDPSVSPRHARLVVQRATALNDLAEQGDYILTDLGSQTGTFVNEERIHTTQLRDGDLLRLGNIEFKFHTGLLTARRSRRLRWIAVVAGGGLFFLLVVAVLVGRSANLKTSAAPEIQIPMERQLEQYLESAHTAMENMDWSKAEQEIDAALDFHPASKEARKLQRKLSVELTNKKNYEDGNVMADMGKLNEALALLRAIPQESVYFGRTKDRVTDLVEKIADEHLKKGRTHWRAERYKQAQEQFSAYLEMKPCDRNVLREYLIPAESKLRRRGIAFASYSGKCEIATAPSTEAKRDRPEEPAAILRKSYPHPVLFEAMSLYVSGKAENAIQTLRRQKDSLQDPFVRRKASALEDLLRVIQGKYEEGLSALRQGRWSDAEQRMRFALDNDAKIVPPTLRSFYRMDIGAQLAKGLNQKAKEEMNRKQWRAAFELWQECLKVHPGDPLCSSGMGELEKIALQYMDAAAEQESAGAGARAAEFWRIVLGITLDESPLNQSARQKLGQND